jgi:hypothetical protein
LHAIVRSLPCGDRATGLGASFADIVEQHVLAGSCSCCASMRLFSVLIWLRRDEQICVPDVVRPFQADRPLPRREPLEYASCFPHALPMLVLLSCSAAGAACPLAV